MKFRKEIEVIPYKKPSPEWFAFRQEGLGASEASAVLGADFNKNESKWSLWQKKVGLVPAEKILTERMFHGVYLEELICDYWRFWDNGLTDYSGIQVPAWIGRFDAYQTALSGGMSPNKQDYTKRSCEKVNAILRHKDYPWLFTNLDRIAYQGQHMVDFQRVCDTIFPVEAKRISDWVANQYIEGVPSAYHVQAQIQQIIMMVRYGEFAMLKDSEFVVKGFWASDDLQNRIIDETQMFWYNNVLPAREMLNEIRKMGEGGVTEEQITDSFNELRQNYEPEADDSELYYDYLTERYKDEISGDSKMTGSPDMLQRAKFYEMWKCVKNYSDEQMTRLKTSITSEMRELKINYASFGEEGKVTWRPNKNSDVPVFRNGVNFSPASDDMDEITGFLDKRINDIVCQPS